MFYVNIIHMDKFYKKDKKMIKEINLIKFIELIEENKIISYKMDGDFVLIKSKDNNFIIKDDIEIVKKYLKKFDYILDNNKSNTTAIITNHNYDNYLDKCLYSVVNQTKKFDRIIVIDDASDNDNAKDICEKYNVEYYKVNFASVGRSRQYATNMVETKFIVNIDADNFLENHFLENHLKYISGNIAIVYSTPNTIDNNDNIIGQYDYVKKEPEEGYIRKQNYIDTCCLIRKMAIDCVNGWDSDIPALQDWSLFLKIYNFGWEFKYIDGNFWNYRQHKDSMINIHNRNNNYLIFNNSHIAVVMLFSGREWCLENVISNLYKLGWNKNKLHGIFINNSCNLEFTQKLNEYLNKLDWNSVNIINCNKKVSNDMSNYDFANNSKHRSILKHKFGEHIVYLYNLAKQHIPKNCDFVLTIEDDQECTSTDIIPKFIKSMSYSIGVVTATIISRYNNDILLSYDLDEEIILKDIKYEKNKKGLSKIGCCGFGLALWRSICWSKYFPLYCNVLDDINKYPYPDIEFGRILNKNNLILLNDWDIKTRHWDIKNGNILYYGD